MMTAIRLLTQQDIPAAMRLKEWAHWNQTEVDWTRLLALEPEGCLVACADDQVVATTTTTRYGKNLAWIGMVLVHPAYRQRGIATTLVRAALDYLAGKGVRTVKLDATPAGAVVYEKLGFRPETMIQRWEGIAQPVASQNGLESGPLTPELFSLDRCAFGADRAALLDWLSRDGCLPPLLAKSSEGRLLGYAMARGGTSACYVGPIVASQQEIAFQLLDGTLTLLAGKPVYLDASPALAASAGELVQRGFGRQRNLVRMYFGEQSGSGDPALVWAIGGPETG